MPHDTDRLPCEARTAPQAHLDALLALLGALGVALALLWGFQALRMDGTALRRDRGAQTSQERCLEGPWRPCEAVADGR